MHFLLNYQFRYNIIINCLRQTELLPDIKLTVRDHPVIKQN
ncbi:hypothetical protein RUMHYD_00673 [Blautia hydrogenotrophica DSM 10507]|uniref:Uncharacterized protein n=1 Tax=Blautia hydrogenotrophica (strain DSM 10507 / JCM 14656 / S5a33) TaxID=476272 RepID=C0CIK9_BLAHS|nr:hypothetical protein RUMHYD_00673 [Blautia hydrogenotrophica DSM 10507]